MNAATRYGTYAMEHLINDILKQGGRRENLEIKLFGGAKVLAGVGDVGRRNVEFVREYLETEGLRVCAENLGGVHPMKVVFDPGTGRARVKKLRCMHNDTIVKRERSYMRRLESQPVSSEVELF